MGTSVRVLHVDGDTEFADVTATRLEREDGRFVVETAADAAAGLARLEAGGIDCIVSEYDVPGSDGIEFLECVREARGDLPFILFTGEGSEAVASEAITAGATDYLRKGRDDQYAALADRIADAVESEDGAGQPPDFETVFRALDIPTVILDRSGDIVVWNAALEELLGIEKKEVEGLENIGTYVYDGNRETILAEKVLAHPQDADEVYGIGQAEREYALLDVPGQPTYEDTSTVFGGSGEDIWFLAVPLYRDGELVGVFEFVQERSDSERQRREMERLLDELTAALSTVQEGDYSAQIEYDFADSLLDEDDVEVLEQVNELARMRKALQEQVRETSEAKRKLERQNDQLEEFANVVSHDLRNPLSVASGELELARADHESEHLESVARAHGRMETLIDDLLNLARSGERVSGLERVDLGTLAGRCWENVDTSGATLVLETDRTLRADEGRLQQLLGNLFRNAVEHGSTSPGSQTSGGAVADVTITVGDCEDGFYVADDGPGIPEADREKVFESGYSTAADGTGFGLRIVEQIVEAHGWEIAVAESADGGARFEITGVETLQDEQ